jgi:SAM-dependent methyltransferase
MTGHIAMSRPSHTDTCRVCGAALEVVFADLGMVPLCQSYVSPEDAHRGEMFYPLRATACLECHYVGLPEYVTGEEIFTEYAYFSSTSTSWLKYAEKSAHDLIATYSLDASSQVIEMGSNDGYLLQHFVARGIPALGVEPAANVAQVANENDIPTLAEFFNTKTAADLRAAGKCADLLLSYNCIDHVADINDIAAAMKMLLKPQGVIQIEAPYLAAMVDHSQFDTIYHDRYSYLSLLCLHEILRQQELRVFDVERIPTHGGSLRVRACHAEDTTRPSQPAVAALLDEERSLGMTTATYYEAFREKVRTAKFALIEQLIELREDGATIVGYGVPAKGNVLLNYCGIRTDLLDYLVDRSPYKCGKLAPGSRLEIRSVDEIRATRPDYLLILPWNIRDEIQEQMSFIRDWDGRFIVPIPRVEIL